MGTEKSPSKNRIEYDKSRHISLLKRKLELDKKNISMWYQDREAFEELRSYELEIVSWFYQYDPDIQKYLDLLLNYTQDKITLQTFIITYRSYNNTENQTLANLLSSPAEIEKLRIKVEELQNIDDKIEALELIERIYYIIDLVNIDDDRDLNLEMGETAFRIAMEEIYEDLKSLKIN